MDERQKLNAGSASMIILFLGGLGALGYLIWDFIAHDDITKPSVLVIMLVAWGLFYLLYQVFGGEAPKNLFGQELPTGNDDEDRSARRRSYLLDASVSAVCLTALSVMAALFVAPDAAFLIPGPLQGPALIAVSAAVEFGVVLAIFYGVDRWMGESASRSYERKMAALEA